MELKPYPVVKDSGVEWLGEVPETWQLLRGKFLFCCVDERSRDGEEELLTVSSKRGVVPRSSTKVTMFKAASYVGYKLCWPGDLVINSLWAWARGLGVSRYHGIISTAYGVYRLRQHYSRYSEYVHRLVRSIPFNYELRVRSKGIWVSRLQLTDEAFLDAPFPIPPAAEITAIVRYLDYAERRIQRYIRVKQKLIELLTEQKQAIIHQAVTGRIDVRTGQPYPVYKPSGVEWLGDVPEHWSIRRLCTLASIATGDMDTVDKRDDGRYPFFVRSQTVERIDTWSFEGETVLTAGDGVGVGRVFHYINGKFNCHQRMYKFSDFIDITGSFFFEYLRAILRFEVMQGTAKATVDSLRLPMLRNFIFVLPMPPEQTAIVRFLNDRSIAINNGIFRAKREINLLHEYRTRLIADVVTGKVDVREAASTLPDVDPLADEDTPGDTFDTDAESDINELDVILEEAEA